MQHQKENQNQPTFTTTAAIMGLFSYVVLIVIVIITI
jgi:hypothetical protein